MLRTVLLASAAAAALAGCKPAGPVPAKPQPGQWELTQSATMLSGPVTAPQKVTRTACLKATDFDFTQLSDQANQLCKTSDISTDPGKVHGRIACNTGTPTESEAVVSGHTTATTMHVEIESTEADSTGGKRKVKLVMDGHRVGECPAK